MHHVAIMDKRLGYIPDIVSGKKSIESRWYMYKREPWDKIHIGDEIYFKDSGKPITAKALVKEVIQISALDREKFGDIVKKYGDLIQIKERSYSEYYQSKNYCILIFLEKAEYIQPIRIDKRGYGSGCAWICVEDIRRIWRS